MCERFSSIIKIFTDRENSSKMTVLRNYDRCRGGNKKIHPNNDNTIVLEN